MPPLPLRESCRVARSTFDFRLRMGSPMATTLPLLEGSVPRNASHGHASRHARALLGLLSLCFLACCFLSWVTCSLFLGGAAFLRTQAPPPFAVCFALLCILLLYTLVPVGTACLGVAAVVEAFASSRNGGPSVPWRWLAAALALALVAAVLQDPFEIFECPLSAWPRITHAWFHVCAPLSLGCFNMYC
jgi:hypothetical protein